MFPNLEVLHVLNPLIRTASTLLKHQAIDEGASVPGSGPLEDAGDRTPSSQAIGCDILNSAASTSSEDEVSRALPEEEDEAAADVVTSCVPGPSTSLLYGRCGSLAGLSGGDCPRRTGAGVEAVPLRWADGIGGRSLWASPLLF